MTHKSFDGKNRNNISNASDRENTPLGDPKKTNFLIDFIVSANY